MSSCATDILKNSPNVNLMELKRLKSDNYITLLMYVVVTGMLLLALSYIVKHLITTCKEYKKNRGTREDVASSAATGKSPLDPAKSNSNPKDATADNEVYLSPGDKGDVAEIEQHMDDKKKQFFKVVDEKFSDYNTLKTKSIANMYGGRTNDDVIDQSIEYQGHDNYTY